MGLVLLTQLCPSELALVLRDKIESGSWKMGGNGSSSLCRIGSGEAWTDEFVVSTAVSGDMTGEPSRELEAAEEALMAEMGTAEVCG